MDHGQNEADLLDRRWHVIAIVIFLRGEGYYIPVLYGFGAAVMVWAFVAESAAVSAERKQLAPASDTGMQRTTHTKLLPH